MVKIENFTETNVFYQFLITWSANAFARRKHYFVVLVEIVTRFTRANFVFSIGIELSFA